MGVPNALETMRRRQDFVAASRDGVKIGGPLIALQMRDRSEPETSPRVGFTATKRVGGAVERNRMKRRMRAAVRETLSATAKPGCDYVLVARRAVLDASFERLKRDLAEAVRRAHGRSGRDAPRRDGARRDAPASAAPAPAADGRREGGR